jgi:rare lipoprotein A
MRHLLISFFVYFLPFLATAQQYEEVGTCSYYADRMNGRNTASGERFDKDLLVAAHRTLPFNTLVRVTNVKNNKTVVVRIIDRGPYGPGRILDISKAAARELDMVPDGVVWVSIESIGMANADSVKAILEQRKIERAARHTNIKTKPKTPAAKAEDGLLQGLFYDQDLLICKPMGYGVQVGYFKSLANCRNSMHLYQSIYKTSIYMYVENKKNVRYYRLVMGQFANKGSAVDLRDAIMKDIPSCFIVSYKDM